MFTLAARSLFKTRPTPTFGGKTDQVLAITQLVISAELVNNAMIL